YLGAERRERTERDVEPYGLFQQGGAWYVVGYCLWRKAIRTFHVARIESLVVNPAAPRTPDFQPRKDVSLAEHALRETWEYAHHPPVRCRVRLHPPMSAEVLASFGGRARVKEEGGGAVVEVDATNAEGLLRHVLGFADRAEILAPKDLRQRARDALSALAEELP
ncbi:MAG TPA: WYL domain-containing protein, partial [Anaeromyxobacteraceae bacterium]|nr:WYL domain-containing protein [Anaeromyxobacteraceae bacterium]